MSHNQPKGVGCSKCCQIRRFSFFLNTFLCHINSQEILLDTLKHKFGVLDDFEYDQAVVAEVLKISYLKDDLLMTHSDIFKLYQHHHSTN